MGFFKLLLIINNNFMTEGSHLSPAVFYWPESHLPAVWPFPGYWSGYAGVTNGSDSRKPAQYLPRHAQQKAAPSTVTDLHSVNIRLKCLIQDVV